VSEPQRLTDIPRLMESIGALAGSAAEAAAAARGFEAELDRLRRRYAGRPPVRVFYEIWHRPLITVSGAHMISDVITLCGGLNVFADVHSLTPSVSFEAVLARKPEVVVGGSSAQRPEDLRRDWKRAPVARLRALPVRAIDPDLIQRQSPRVVQGARLLCEALEDVRRRSASGVAAAPARTSA
jgi:iron complex transport system substrate-binding protein